MPFQQPALMTVRQTYFRGKTFVFPVESVLAPGAKGGLLRLKASENYLLTTSANKTPLTEQTLPYVEQPDGSWRVSGAVNLTATATALISGSVTLHDPLGETLILPIRIDPTLFVDSYEINFDETKIGESMATILNIRQRGALTPVNLRVEPNHQFSIADPKMAMISASELTFTPAFEGSNVIVTYKPNRAGRNAARLVITTPYETQTVQLVGQPGGLLGRFQWPELPRLQWPATPHRGPVVGALAAVVFGVMVWMTYGLLAQSENKIALTVWPQTLAEPHTRLASPTRRPKKAVEQLPQITLVEKSKEKSTSVEPPTSKSLPQSQEKVVTKQERERIESEQSNQIKLAIQQPKAMEVSIEPEPLNRPKPMKVDKPVLAKSSVPISLADQISDLERELNGSDSPKQP